MRLGSWKASTAGGHLELAEVLKELSDCVYIHPESGRDRWIPRDWITEQEDTDG